MYACMYIQCSLDIRGGCDPRVTTKSKKPGIIDAPSLVTPLSEKHFFKVNVHPTVSVQCSIEVQWLISCTSFLRNNFLLVNANKIKIRQIDKMIYY
jgi:hypothetical protein